MLFHLAPTLISEFYSEITLLIGQCLNTCPGNKWLIFVFQQYAAFGVSSQNWRDSNSDRQPSNLNFLQAFHSWSKFLHQVILC